jgi:hypothetical protein
MFRLFTASLSVVLDFLILQDKQNVCSLSLNIKLICTRSKTLIEKLAMGLLFYLLLKLVQINYVFFDNVRILIV